MNVESGHLLTLEMLVWPFKGCRSGATRFGPLNEYCNHIGCALRQSPLARPDRRQPPSYKVREVPEYHKLLGPAVNVRVRG